MAVLDADDVARPDRLERQVAYLRDHPECVAVGSRALIIDAGPQPPKRVRSPEFVTLFSRGD